MRKALWIRTGVDHLEVVVVLDEVLELDLVFGGEVAQPVDVFLLAVGPVAAEPLASEKGHANPGQTRGPVQLQDVSGVREAPRAREFNQAHCSMSSHLGGSQVWWFSAGV